MIHDSFAYLLRHGSESTLLIERAACAATADMRIVGDGPDAEIVAARPDMVARIVKINERLAQIRYGASSPDLRKRVARAVARRETR